MSNVELITGHTGVNHITSLHGAIVNASGLGNRGKYIVDIGNRCGLTVEGNTAFLDTGYVLNQGRLIEVTKMTEIGLSQYFPTGAKKVLILGVNYQVTDDIESSDLEIIEGTSGDEYIEPTINEGNLFNGDTYDIAPLWRIKLNGNVVEAIERIAPIWYIDDGWRQSNTIIGVDNPEALLAGPTAKLRVNGTQVFLKIDIVFGSQTINLTLNPEFAPKEFIKSYDINNRITVTVNTSGNINLRQPTPVVQDCSIRLSWFLD